jgi:subtilisin family serine protease
MARTSRIGRKTLTAVAAASLLTTVVVTATASPASGQPTKAKSTKSLATAHAANKLKITKAQLSKLRAPIQKVDSDLSGAKGLQTVFVQTSGSGAAAVSRRTLAAANGTQAARTASAKNAAVARRAAIVKTTASVMSTAKSLDSSARQIYTIKNLVPGVAMSVDASALKALATRSDVVKISKIVPKTASNASAAQLTKVLNTWVDTGNTGSGVTVGVIDTGIDFTHADFGGTGTKAAYQTALANDASQTDAWYTGLPALAQAKIAGGTDFAGDTYQADPASANYQPVPHPDADPLDCTDHGTHVSGTVAGYGVNSDGSTFLGDYHTLTGADLDGMRIGPGMAPSAKLYPLRVFGCAGSTDLVGEALDAAADPNGDGDFGDHLDIVNLSLGSDFGPADDPENAQIDALAAVGTLPVIAEGNAGDITDAGGTPGNAPRALAVASTVDAMQLRDGLQVNAPSAKAGVVAGQNSIAYDYSTKGDVLNKQVVALPPDPANTSGDHNLDGCNTLSADEAAAVAGKVAWLEWDDNDATRQCGSVGRSANVKAAGAVGAIFTSSLDVFGAGITGDTDIPVIQLSKTSTDTLRPALTSGAGGTSELNVSFKGSLAGTIKDKTAAIVDTLSSFSSRGSHGSYGEPINPSVAAPGDTITSAGMGTGNDQLTISGTSMATPHTAGIAALVKAANPLWTTEQIKADIVNTAGHDVYSHEGQTGPVYGPDRVGAGRVDALAAVTNGVLAYNAGDPGSVTTSFGVVEVPTGTTVTKSKTITVENTSSSSKTLALSYHPIVTEPGVTYTVTPSSLTIAAGASALATVKVTAVSSQLRHTIDPTMATQTAGNARQYVSDASGNLLITPTGGTALRLPVYTAAKPVSSVSTHAAYADGQYSLVSTGKGFTQGSGSTELSSISSIMQLGATSPEQPNCSDTVTNNCVSGPTDKSGDIHYVGAGSVPGPTGSYDGGWLYFGISTYGDSAATGHFIQPAVDFDTTGDGVADWEVYVTQMPSSDVYIAGLYSIADAETVDAQPLNFELGDVDTNIFDNNSFVLPVSIDDLNVVTGADSLPITYNGITYSAVNGVQDTSASATFDAFNPALELPVPDGNVPLFDDQSGTLPVTANESVKALIFHLHNGSGARDQVVALAKQDNSALTISAPAKVTYGHSGTVRGELIDTTTHSALAGVKVGLYGKTGSGAYSLRTTKTTNSAGQVSAVVAPTSKTTYQWRYAGESPNGATQSAAKTVLVEPVVSLSASSKKVAKNEKFQLYGTTQPATAHAKLAIQEKVKGKWKTVATVKTKKQKLPNGKRVVGYVVGVKLAKNGSFHFRASWAAHSGLTAATSKTVIVKVKS